VAAGCKKINRSHTHTDREQHPRHRHTHTRQEQHPKPPNEHLPQTLNTARRWRDDGACHRPRPGWWPRRSQECVRASGRGVRRAVASDGLVPSGMGDQTQSFGNHPLLYANTPARPLLTRSIRLPIIIESTAWVAQLSRRGAMGMCLLHLFLASRVLIRIEPV